MEDDENVPEQDENASQEETEEETPETTEEAKPEAAEEPRKAQEPRKVWTMPVEKAQEEKRRAAEKARAEAEAAAEERIAAIRAEYEAKMASSRPDAGFDGEIEAVAAKYNLEPDAAKDLLGALEKKISARLPDLSKYDQIVRDREVEAARAKVLSDFDEKVAPQLLKDFPHATPDHVLSVRNRVAELAFTEGYNAYRIEDIYAVRKGEFEFKNGFSAEASGGRSSELTDFSKMTDEQEIELFKRDRPAYEKYLKWQSAKESKFIN